MQFGIIASLGELDLVTELVWDHLEHRLGRETLEDILLLRDPTAVGGAEHRYLVVFRRQPSCCSISSKVMKLGADLTRNTRRTIRLSPFYPAQ